MLACPAMLACRANNLLHRRGLDFSVVLVVRAEVVEMVLRVVLEVSAGAGLAARFD